MKVWLDENYEDQPTMLLREEPYYTGHPTIEVPDELVIRHEQAWAEWEASQTALGAYLATQRVAIDEQYGKFKREREAAWKAKREAEQKVHEAKMRAKSFEE